MATTAFTEAPTRRARSTHAAPLAPAPTPTAQQPTRARTNRAPVPQPNRPHQAVVWSGEAAAEIRAHAAKARAATAAPRKGVRTRATATGRPTAASRASRAWRPVQLGAATEVRN